MELWANFIRSGVRNDTPACMFDPTAVKLSRHRRIKEAFQIRELRSLKEAKRAWCRVYAASYDPKTNPGYRGLQF